MRIGLTRQARVVVDPQLDQLPDPESEPPSIAGEVIAEHEQDERSGGKRDARH